MRTLVWKLALRDARRHWWAMVLAAVVIAAATVPAIALVAGTAGTRATLRVITGAGSHRPADVAPPTVRTGAAGRVRLVGGGAAIAFSSSSNSFDATPTAASGSVAVVPAGARVATFGLASRTLVGNGRQIRAWVADPDLGTGTLRSETTLVAGRRPGGPGEVAIARSTLEELRSRLGDALATPGTAPALRVVGVLRDPVDVGSDEGSGLPPVVGVVAPGALRDTATARAWIVSQLPGFGGAASGGGSGSIGASDGGSGAVEARPASFAYRISGGGSGRADSVAAAFGAAVLFLLPSFLASAIFSVGLRSRAREQHLLVLAGATPRDLRRVARLRGLIVAAGAVVGSLAVAVVGGWLPLSGLDRYDLLVVVPCLLACGAAVSASTSTVPLARRLVAERSLLDRPLTGAELRGAARRLALLIGVAVVLLVVVRFSPTAVAAFLVLGAVGAALAALTPLTTLAIAAVSRLARGRSVLAAGRSVGRCSWIAGPAATVIVLASLVALARVNDSNGPANALGEGRLVAVGPGSLIDGRGRHVVPRATAARTIGASRVAIVAAAELRTGADASPTVILGDVDGGPVYSASATTLAALGFAPAQIRPGVLFASGEKVGDDAPPLTTAALQTDRGEVTTPVLVGPALGSEDLPRFFLLDGDPRAVSLARGGTTWLGISDRRFSRSQRLAIRRRAAAEGLVAQVAPIAGTSGPRRRVLAGVAATAALVAGALATLLLLAERREDDRLLALAGASSSTRRRSAAGLAFAFSLASILAVAVSYLLILLGTLIAGGSASLAPTLGLTLLVLLPVPFVLALATGLLYRPPPVDRLGRLTPSGALRRARPGG